jgi:hypothetical protein
MIESYLDGILLELLLSPVVATFKTLKREVGDEDGYVRIRCTLSNSNILEFAEYLLIHKNRIHIETYSFHWQTAGGELIKRWDNVEHHKEIDTFPYHIHLANGKVLSSAPANLKKVLADIEKTIHVNGES